MVIGTANWRSRSFWAAISVGTALFGIGLTFPVYHDNARASQLKNNACEYDGKVVDGWFDQLSELETLRHPLMQGGLSIVLATLTCWLLWTLFKSNDRKCLMTPSGRPTFFVLGVGVLFLSWLAQMVSLVIDQRRGDFPWCTDSIFIPMVSMTFAYGFLLALCLLVGGGLAIGLRSLPTALFAWDKQRPVRNWLLTIPFALIAGIIAALAINEAYLSAFIGTPAAVVALYLVESTRSALIVGKSEGERTAMG